MRHADQEVLVLGQGHKAQAEGMRRGFQADACVSLPAGHGGGHGVVAVLGAAVAQLVFLQLGLCQQVLREQPRGRAGLPPHEARAQCGHIGQALDVQGVARGHHQTLRAAAAADELVHAGLQQRLQAGREQRRAILQGRHVKACHGAAAFGQRAQRVDAAGKTQVDVQLLFAAGRVAQRGQGQVVAGVQGQHLLPAVQRVGQHAAQFGAQGFDVRREAHAGLRLGPQQPLGKGGQACGLALRPVDERLADGVLPFAQLAPHVAVAQAQGCSGALDAAAFVYGLQQVEQRVVDRGAGLRVGLETVLEVDAAGLHARIVMRRFSIKRRTAS